jgi:hypothetical protein
LRRLWTICRRSKGVDACILYRIDGVPIILRARGYNEYLLDACSLKQKKQMM